ncbi:MAG: cobalamin B12-binding domain-containing protein [Methanobacteriaceae archaeon]|nr:cobalamin B12-binding domain-containing protein [Methanobacteriaceae archaeon]
MSEFEEESGPLADLAKMYLDALLRVQRDAASRMIIKAAEEGTSIKDIYLYVFEPSQHEVGRLWQTNQITVAQEHFCSAATQMIMSQLYPYIFGNEKNGYKMVATCAEGEQHEIGVRMVADLFEMEGWDTYYLGANTPTESILATIKQLEPHLLAVSASIHYNVKAVSELIKSVKESPYSEIKIIVGGRPFQIAPELWKKVGADACAFNAQDAIDLANELIL